MHIQHDIDSKLDKKNTRTIELTSAYGASPVLVSRASRSAVASFSQLEADRKLRPKRWSGPLGRTRPGP